MTLPVSTTSSVPLNNGYKGGESHPASPARSSQPQQPNGAATGIGAAIAGGSRGVPPPPISTGLQRQFSGNVPPFHSSSSSRPSLPSSSLPSLPTARSAASPAQTPAPTSAAAASPAPFPGQVDAVPGPSTQPYSLEKEAANRKRKWESQGYTREEQEYLEQRSNELHLSLLLDQEETIHSSPARFTSYEDMVNRLLPWHVWQIHDEELEVGRKTEGARGAALEEREKAEAGSLVGRIQRVHERFATARRREGNPNRRSFDMLSLIKMTKESSDSYRAELAPLQSRLQSVEAVLRGQQDVQRKAEAERRRVLEEEERRRIKAADDARKAYEAKLAKEAKEAADAKAAKVAKEKADAAALAAAAAKRVAAANAAAAASPAKKATAESPGKGTPTRGRGRPRGRGGRGGTSLRETVLTHQSTSTPSSPAPLTPTAAPKSGSPSLPPSPAGPSTPAAGPSRNASPSKLANGPGTPRANIPLGTPPIPGSKAPQAPITLAIKPIVLPQLMRLGLLPIPGHIPTVPPPAPYPAHIKGHVPNSPTGDVYLQVAQQLQGLAKALNIPVPDPAQKAGGLGSNPGSPAPLPPLSSGPTTSAPVAKVPPAVPAPVIPAQAPPS